MDDHGVGVKGGREFVFSDSARVNSREKSDLSRVEFDSSIFLLGSVPTGPLRNIVKNLDINKYI